jgi:TPR repeat protein
VSNLPDKTMESPSHSELNPLTNPLLERNLGRWAKVYFSNPPAKRNQAVNNLLEEIMRESGTARNVERDRPYFPRDPNYQGGVCAACQRQNPPGHKFCSRCGEILTPAQVEPRENPVSPPLAAEASSPRPANDVQWLRERAFAGIDGSDVPQRRTWKYLVGGFAIVLAGFAYLQWTAGSRVVPTPATPPPNASEISLPAGSSSPAVATRPAETITPESKVGVQNTAALKPAHDRTTVPSGLQPAAQKSPLLDAAVPGDGSSDLRLAQRYLGGGMGVRDSSEAAKLLWKAVSKQNATAAVLLSDLYLRGDGVPKSCDQARLLLLAAAKRGAPQAAEPLQRLESQDCH